METATPTREELVTIYKGMFQSIIDRNPSGLRQRIAEKLSTHRSFVSQISSPLDKTPIPAKHLMVLFELCHFTEDERARFMSVYTAAHPRHKGKMSAKGNAKKTQFLKIEVPVLGSSSKQKKLERLLEDMAKRIAEIS